ncbi:hypothetical protein BX666DRAFT_2028263 [Dichotomocladium elegans]|nr:hypothetical protein BX666DRAFT_2028263 [Dichotomocladium elegans]
MSSQDLYHINQRIAPRQKMPEQPSQVIVPSMFVPGPFYYYPIPPYPTTATTTTTILPIPSQQRLTIGTCHAPPIHHTLENATITYDTVVEHSKDLVKDVFFSPAMATEGRDSEGSSICGQSDSDESDVSYSPSDLLQDDDPLFFIGLDLNETTDAGKQQKQSPLHHHHHQQQRHHHSHSHNQKPFAGAATTAGAAASAAPASAGAKSTHVVSGTKRRLLASTAAAPLSAKKAKISPPGSPVLDYFDDASAEESSDDEDTPSVADLQISSIPDDNESTSSWEERADFFDETDNEDQKEDTQVDPRPTQHPTIYQKLTKANVDWCRYCGTTEGVNWRPGPWGKRTLCNKHGCDYKGYGFACKLPRLDLTGFAHETIHDRDRPVLQLFCSVCHRQESWQDNVLVRCEGCPKAVHQRCCASHQLTNDFVASDDAWFCDPACQENARRKRIVVELPRKRLPLMCAPKSNSTSPSLLHQRISSSSSSISFSS